MEEEKGLKYPCRACGDREAIVSKTTGEPTHWLCKECFGEKHRAAYARKREEKERLAKAEVAADTVTIEGAAKEIVLDIRSDSEAYQHPGTESEEKNYSVGTGNPPKRSVFLGFDACPEIGEWIVDRAKEQFRTVEAQILWELKGPWELEMKCKGCGQGGYSYGERQ